MEDKTTKSKIIIPWVTFALILLQVFVFLFEQKSANANILGYVLDDYDFNWTLLLQGPIENFPRLISHLFFHADINHIFYNALFFLIFAPAVENRVGSKWFLILFFVWGITAALVQASFTPYSPGLIGASGAVSGAMGAYFVLYPLRGPFSFLPLGVFKIVGLIPSFVLIGLWVVTQIQYGYDSLLPQSLVSHVSQVGYWAHIGGFASGAITIFPFVFAKNRLKN